MLIRYNRSDVYRKVIEVNCPIRFYWDEGFDGVELTCAGMTIEEQAITGDLLDSIGSLIGTKDERGAD